jgi:hypothetical protein
MLNNEKLVIHLEFILCYHLPHHNLHHHPITFTAEMLAIEMLLFKQFLLYIHPQSHLLSGQTFIFHDINLNIKSLDTDL